MELKDIAGVGEKTVLDLNKLGINNLEDLITYYPKRYFILRRSDIKLVSNGDNIITDGVVLSMPVISSYGKLLKSVFRLQTSDNIFNVVVFNQVYLCKNLKVGESVIVIGKYEKYRKSITVSEIRKGKITGPKVEAIYQLGSVISNKSFSNLITKVLNSGINILDNLPLELQDKYNFRDKLWCIKELHNPSSTVNYKRAVQRLKYEELYNYFFQIKNIKKINMDINKCIKRDVDNSKIQEFINSFKFELTTDQVSVINDIKDDLIAARRMNRLVQGDVGSGKTIVAMVAVYINYLAGYQSAMMVPTEILASQHYDSAISLFNNFGVRVCLLTSNVKNKNKLYKEIENGDYDFIIGTQSLIQDALVYKNLGLVITDEQHRFGVNQRRSLANKGRYLDILSMSATPIPRTYALTIYGDMDVSSIKTKPANRKDVKTYFKTEKEIIDVLKLMQSELIKGHQVYVIASSIDGNDNELDNVSVLTDKMKLAFGSKYLVSSIHGKMDVNNKNKIMDDFLKHKSDILISTTVIEVGVNVPNSSVIVIFNANNYGLSTLHQLRGRVGRGDIQSYCVLVAKEASERLKFLESCSDGFKISEYDFKNRGEGDLFGVRQSGAANFKLVNVLKDFELLLRVRDDVLKMDD